MSQLKIVSVNRSVAKGTIKMPVPTIELTSKGVDGDAHAGNWNRQVSMLAIESIREFESRLNRAILPGEFAENISTEGFRLNTLRPLDILMNDNVVIEISQIGKRCHGENCDIFRQTGDCVMPREGIFARVVEPGRLSPGDTLVVRHKVIEIEIITLSDRAFKGIYEDRSGPLAAHLVKEFFANLQQTVNIVNTIIDDDAKKLHRAVIDSQADVLFTTGGTGIGPRDITPDTIAPLLDRQIPGIMELIRVKYGADKPNALLSRSVAGTRGRTLIYTLPGSSNGVKEYLEVITPTLLHSIYMLHGLDIH